MKRDILNYQGIKIGELEMSDDTSEEVWTQELSRYAVAPTRVIPDVTPRQFRQALVHTGFDVNLILSAINSLPEPMKSIAAIEWEYSVAFQRDNELVNMMGPTLGFTPESLDQLWLLAGTL